MKRPKDLVEDFERQRRAEAKESRIQSRAIAAGYAENYLEKHLYPDLKEFLWDQVKEAHGDGTLLASVAATAEALDAIIEMARADARKRKKRPEEPKDVR